MQPQPGMSFECMQPVQTHMHPVQYFCGSIAGSGVPAPAPQTQDLHNKQFYGAGQSNGEGGTQTPTTAGTFSRTSSYQSQESGQTSSARLCYTNNDNKQLEATYKQSAPKTKNSASAKSRKQAAIVKVEKPSKASIGTDSCAIGQNSERCHQIIEQLESRGAAARTAFLCILPATRALALSKCGCRVIQKAIEVGSLEDIVLLVAELTGHIAELSKSPHGNHVVAKFIEVLPPGNLGFIVAELAGSIPDVAKHQYGCRLLERLLEHCPAQQVASLVEELLPDAEPLCRHRYGNFVMQHIFEHGLQPWKDKIAGQIVSDLPLLAKHRTASHVVQRALEFGGDETQFMLISALVKGHGEDSLIEIACSRYGSFVVEELASIHACREVVRQLLQDGLPRLLDNQYGKRAIAKFGFPLPLGEITPAFISTLAGSLA